MLPLIYRYSSIANYLINFIRFKNLRYGRNVIINLNKTSQFTYGAGTWLAEGTLINIFDSQLHLGQRVNICKNTQLLPGKSGIHIGDHSKIQENARILGEITIGNHVIIGPNFYISSGIHVFNQEPHTLINLQDKKFDAYADPCIIEDDCWLGINVSVMPGVKIRRGCIIGAGAVVTHSTEPYAIYGGIPAKKIGIRLLLGAKEYLNATHPEDLPYFYQGFNHFDYNKHKLKYGGITTNAKQFSFYTDQSPIKSVRMKIEPLFNKVVEVYHKNNLYTMDPHKNEILIQNVEVNDKLISFESNDALIVKHVFFE